ncbi:MAG: hypothetical protein LBK18_09750 [Prevotellaceae bacterium]|jgi:hypothetical protein|nr:hypothetical protein [Prevotellaceae bacterium]
MAGKKRIYRLSFKAPVGGKTDYFFGSLSAIYEAFSPQEVGCRVTRLWNVKITEANPYIGRKCTITREPLKIKKAR